MAPTETGSGAERQLPETQLTAAELLQLLPEAADLEHCIACRYLFPAYSLKHPGSDVRSKPDQWTLIQGWSDIGRPGKA
jgi:hypothetical protein